MWRSNLIGPVLALLIAATFGCREHLASIEGVIVRPGQPDLAYRMVGRGRDTVVVLHGGPGLSRRYFEVPLDPLVAEHTVISYDLRGRGRSGEVADSTQMTLTADVEDLEAIRRYFGLDRLKLIGHHWGGAVAAQYAVAHPAQVERMVLVSPYVVHRSFLTQFTFVTGDSALWREALSHVGRVATPAEATEFCRSWWPTYFSPLPPHPATPYGRLAETICDVAGERLLQIDRTRRWLLQSVGPTPWREALSRTRVATLVIEGAGDSTVTHAATRWAQHLPDARVMLLPAPYLFPWIGAPRRFLGSIDEFLAGRWPAGAEKPAPFLPGQAWVGSR